jgi:hypothetical protein
MTIPVIDAEKLTCPFMNGSPCMGKACCAWRWADVRKVMGYCGVAGTPLTMVRNNA